MTSWGRIATFDLETTGVDTDTARIVSACIAVLDDSGSVLIRWDWLADPGVPIPEGAAAVHGITTERARAEGRDATVVIAEVAQSIRALLGLGIPLVVYNAPYDLTLLDRECRRHGLEPVNDPAPIIDPLVIDKALDRYRKGKRTLEAAASLYGVALDDAHDAGADAVAAARVAQALGAAYPEELAATAAELHLLQRDWYADQAASFTDYIRRVKGDQEFTANASWPIKPLEYPTSILDTAPIPIPLPRPSRIVPHLDFDTGRLELEGAPIRLELGVGSDETSFEAAPTTVSARLRMAAAVAMVPPVTMSAPPATSPTALPSAYATAPPPRRRPDVVRLAAGILTDGEGRSLLVRRRGSTSFGHAGGEIGPAESALKALSRELQTQLEIEIDLDRTEYLGSFREAGSQESDPVVRAEIFAVNVGGELEPHGDLEELLWIDSEPGDEVELEPISRTTIMPLWTTRKSALF